MRPSALRPPEIMQRTFTVIAKAGYTEAVKGKVFALISSDAPIDVEIDNHGRQTFVPGRTFAGAPFSRIRFFETSGSNNAITFYAGDQDIALAPTTNDGAYSKVSATSFVKDAATYSLAAPNSANFVANSLDIHASIVFTGSDVGGQQRKQISVSNGDAANSIQIKDQAGNIFALVQPGQTWTHVSSGYFKVYNPNGAAINCAIGETFYA